MKIQELFKNRKFRFLIIALAFVAPFELLSFFSIHLSLWIELPIFSLFILFFGKDVFISGIQALTKFNFSNINLLMTIAIIGAVYLGEFEEAAIIVILFALGNALEDLGIERSQKALEELVEKTPKSALLKGKKEKTAIEQIMRGDVMVIKPGDYIALDGEVVEGTSLIDESSITGEPLPRNKYVGDTVYAGTINKSGYLEVKVTKETKDTTLAKIIDLTYQSIEQKSRSQRFIETFAQYYTPTVLVIAICLVIVPVYFFGQPFTIWFKEALTLLLISCPCALVISTPVTIFSAIGNATKRGILVKGGRFLEEMGKINAIAFDKTRTLTKGETIVSDIIPYTGATEEGLLACVAGIESMSEHPLAKSIINRAMEAGLSSHRFTNFKALMGKGLTGECTVCIDRDHCIGNLKFILESHAVDKNVIKQVEAFEKQGKTAIVITEGKKVSGIIGITDEIRRESKNTIATLIKQGIMPIMLTGDNTSAARFVGESLGIEEIYADLLPQDKLIRLDTLRKKYASIAMVGDGVNDAPALASASVGIAMGAIGSDVAVENADIALMNNNLLHIPFLVNLGRTSTQTIRFNTTVAIVTKFLFLLLALLGRSNLTMAIFADVGVTVFVVLNSLRLYGYQYSE